MPSLDPADLRLVYARPLGKLLLGQVLRAALVGELPGEREVKSECLELGESLGARARFG